MISKLKLIFSKNKKIIYFILRVLIIYLAWKVLSFILGEESTPIQDRMWPWLSTGWESLNDKIRIVILSVTQLWFNVVGLDSEIVNGYRLWVYDYAFVGVGNYCLAIQLWIFFVALIVSYSGKWYNKLWFSLIGIILINVINVFRLIAVVYAAHYYPEYIQFNHDYIFNVLVYIFTFFMWIWWVKRFSFERKEAIE